MGVGPGGWVKTIQLSSIHLHSHSIREFQLKPPHLVNTPTMLVLAPGFGLLLFGARRNHAGFMNHKHHSSSRDSTPL